ncbi:polyamine ABC transporter permease [Azorhizobium oxalatiphilum]|uniref:Polyamine ABC transporter permease n=1 Tax=Azorhizobium oxalatiphilum TaxID=980631 RepID=A0A917BKX0_9HYPH|nr:ABC transporter permease [Azorhizobium oxalatiphilum]GGF47431.1 polyamine ABC transporter permease [Azorhizobium oxalatiphilum]
MTAIAPTLEAAPARRVKIPLAVILLIPITLINLIGFVAPVINLLSFSFREVQATGAMTGGSSIASWVAIVTDPFYIELLVNSILTSLLIVVLTLVCSFPIALLLHRTTGFARTVLLFVVITPLLTSAVVRTYGWIALLLDGGVINSLLSLAGLPTLKLIFNSTGVVIGLTEILMPYMILSLLAGFRRLDPRVEEAALTLGANPFQTFWRIIVPLTLPGVALGSLLCFVLAVSSFITPKLLGGGRVFLLATEIYDQAMVTLNWPLASTLAIMILIVFGGALFLYLRALRAIA